MIVRGLRIFILEIVAAILVIGTLSLCSKKVMLPPGNEQDAKTTAFLEQVFQKSGGLENWNSKKALRFRKTYALYDENGNVEIEVAQHHDYTLKDGEDSEISIKWNKNGDKHQLISRYGSVLKTVNDILDSNTSEQSARNAVASSTFVIDLPFNLNDASIGMEYLGKDTLHDGAVVDVLKADFSPDLYSNHTSEDTWWYYFDDYILIGYMVRHDDHYSYVRNTSATKVNGFTLPEKRKSWRVNPNGELLYLRADYMYSDYQIDY